MKKAMLSVAFGVALATNSVYAADTPADQQPITKEASQATESKPAVIASIDCNYHIPANTTKIEDSLVLQWSAKAVQQAFALDYSKVDTQLKQLKNCFTDQGWQGFNDALEKSGNLKAIQVQKLSMTSTIDGQPAVVEAKENQWKIQLPLQVLYQNDNEKLTQMLSVDLLVGRKISGDLGILQMIASPRKTAEAKTSAVP